MKKKNSIKSKVILLVLSAVCGVMIVLSFTVDMSSGPLKQVGELIITPLQSGINQVGSWIAGKGDYFQNSADLVTENKSLQKKVDDLTIENTRLIQDQEELNRLRDLYELDHQYEDYEKVGARVIAKQSGNWFHMFTIDKGSNDGFAVDMNVLAGGGLAGIITEVGPNWSTVRSIIDDYSNVSAMVSPTNEQCIIAGDLRLIDEDKVNLIKLTDTDNKVSVGDKVVTSNVSSKFLPGILIGYISEINNDSNHLTKSGYISPAVDFKDIQEVLVIKTLKQQIATTETEPKQTEAKGLDETGDSETETSSETETQSTESPKTAE
ncbi:rod shape-determining protein MreC [uncultured Robinsoniella sp.]|uniref:rod shape-determining protein MreC n=1 Tax=uncultured Robinsoniella sp. TaxID=904190 RepID=UPI00374EFE6C